MIRIKNNINDEPFEKYKYYEDVLALAHAIESVTEVEYNVSEIILAKSGYAFKASNVDQMLVDIMNESELGWNIFPDGDMVLCIMVDVNAEIELPKCMSDAGTNNPDNIPPLME